MHFPYVHCISAFFSNHALYSNLAKLLGSCIEMVGVTCKEPLCAHLFPASTMNKKIYMYIYIYMYTIYICIIQCDLTMHNSYILQCCTCHVLTTSLCHSVSTLWQASRRLTIRVHVSTHSDIARAQTPSNYQKIVPTTCFGMGPCVFITRGRATCKSVALGVKPKGSMTHLSSCSSQPNIQEPTQHNAHTMGLFVLLSFISQACRGRLAKAPKHHISTWLKPCKHLHRRLCTQCVSLFSCHSLLIMLRANHFNKVLQSKRKDHGQSGPSGILQSKRKDHGQSGS